MRRIKPLSRRWPHQAQFTPLNEFVQLLSLIVGVINNINRSFNTHFLVKDTEQ